MCLHDFVVYWLEVYVILKHDICDLGGFAEIVVQEKAVIISISFKQFGGDRVQYISAPLNNCFVSPSLSYRRVSPVSVRSVYGIYSQWMPVCLAHVSTQVAPDSCHYNVSSCFKYVLNIRSPTSFVKYSLIQRRQLLQKHPPPPKQTSRSILNEPGRASDDNPCDQQYYISIAISPLSKYTAFSKTLGWAAVIHIGVRGSSRLSLKSSLVQSPTCKVVP